MLYRVHLTWLGFRLTTLVLIGTDCIGSCISNYHTSTTMMAPNLLLFFLLTVTTTVAVSSTTTSGKMNFHFNVYLVCDFHGINYMVEISWCIFRISADYCIYHLVNNVAIHIYTHYCIRMEKTVSYLKISRHQLSI
jgi:hypothetical protein